MGRFGALFPKKSLEEVDRDPVYRRVKSEMKTLRDTVENHLSHEVEGDFPISIQDQLATARRQGFEAAKQKAAKVSDLFDNKLERAAAILSMEDDGK